MKFFSSIAGALGLCVAYTHGAQDIFLSEGDVNMYDYLQNIQDMQQSGEAIDSKIPQSLSADSLTPDDVAQMESLLTDYYSKQLETDLKSSSGAADVQQLADSLNDAAKDTLLELAQKSNEELLAEVLQLSQELNIEITQEEAIETATLLKSIIDTQVSLLGSTDETESAKLLSNLMDMYAQLETADNTDTETNMYIDVDDVKMAIDSLTHLLEFAQTESNVEDSHTQQPQTVYNAGRETLQKLSRRSMKKHTFMPEPEPETAAPNLLVDDSEVLPSLIM